MSTKEAYIEKAQAKVEEYTAKLALLKAQAKGAIAEQKIDSHEEVDLLETKIKAAELQIIELKNASEEAWGELSSRFDTLTDELSNSVAKFFAKQK